VTCFFVITSYGQKGISAEQGALSASLGGVSTVITSSDAVLNNFSNSTNTTNSSAILSSSRRFSLSELSGIAIGVHLPSKKLGHFGLELYNYGFESYSEQHISLKYARKLLSNLSISSGLGIQNLRVQDNGSAQKIVFSLGLAGSISEDLSYGVLLTNPEKQSFNENTDLVSRVAFGLKYIVSERVDLYGELDKQLEENLAFKGGLDYKIHTTFNLRIGFNTLPGQMSFGFGTTLVK